MSRKQITLPWADFPACPCGCGVEGLKLQVRHDGHLVGCICRVCLGRRNKYKGQKAQAKMHRALGGTGFTPSNEESAIPYVVEVLVKPESKAGKQIPASWRSFVSSVWFRHALFQSERAVPFGTAVVPGLVIDGRWLVADLKLKKGQRVA
jgi:hypothetical protein